MFYNHLILIAYINVYKQNKFYGLNQVEIALTIPFFTVEKWVLVNRVKWAPETVKIKLKWLIYTRLTINKQSNKQTMDSASSFQKATTLLPSVCSNRLHQIQRKLKKCHSTVKCLNIQQSSQYVQYSTHKRGKMIQA